MTESKDDFEALDLNGFGTDMLEEAELETLDPKPEPVLTKANAVQMLGGLPVQSIGDVTSAAGTFLIYGDFGIGKTPLAASAVEVPELAPVLFLDFEHGMRSARRYSSDPRIRVIELGDQPDTNYKGTATPKGMVMLKTPSIKSYAWNQAQAVYDDLYTNCRGYKTVVIDTLSEAYQLGMGLLMNGVVDNADNKMEDTEVPSPREYGIMLKRTRTLVRGFKQLGINVICLAHAKEDQLKNGKKVLRPNFPGKVAVELPVFFDYVFYFDIVQAEVNGKVTQIRRLQTKKTEDVAARSREDVDTKLPKFITDPSMLKIHNMIKDEA